MGEYETLCPMGVRTGARIYGALRSLLAALDADKRLEEAGAIITQLSREWVRVDTAARCAALAWLARREGKGENRG